MKCPVGIHHGPGHQSTTKCQIKEPHEVHEAVYGSYGETARWKGGDILSGIHGYDDGPDEDELPSYVSDTKWYQDKYEEFSKKYPPKDYHDPRLP